MLIHRTLLPILGLALLGAPTVAQCEGVGRLAATSATFFDNYGEQLAISGTWAAVPVELDFWPAEEEGAIDLWRWTPADGWALHDQVPPYDIPGVTMISRVVAMDGAELLAFAALGDPLVAAPWARTEKVVVMRRQGPMWSVEQVITSPLPEETTRFGTSLDISGDRLVVGANQFDGDLEGQGRVFVYSHTPGQGWQLDAGLSASDIQQFAWYGSQVVLVGDDLAVSAPNAETAGFDDGVVYMYEHNGVQFLESARLHPDDSPGVPDGEFGRSLDLAGNVLAVGRPESTGSAGDEGSVFVFRRGGGDWPLDQILLAATINGAGHFGRDVRVGAGRLLVGAPTAEGTRYAGMVHEYTEVGGVWTLQTELEPCDGNYGDGFGAAIALSGQHLLVGAPFDDANADSEVPGYGVFHALEHDGLAWQPVSEHMQAVEVSAARGGRVGLFVFGDGPAPGDIYVMLGSMTGSSPGVVLKGVHVPLNFDAYFELLLGLPGAPTFAQFQGGFSGTNGVQALLTVPAGLPPVFVGLELSHAWLQVNGSQVLAASEAESVIIEP